MKLRIFLVLIITAVVGTLYTNCGANQTPTGGTDFSSRDDIENPTPNGLLSVCNKFSSSTMTTYGTLSSYRDPATNLYVNDWIRMRLRFGNNMMSTNANIYLHLFRFSEDSSGRSTNSSPVKMLVQAYGDANPMNQGSPITTLSRATVTNLISTYSLGNKGITTSNFFDKVIFILTEMDLTYDAITVAYYDASVGTQAYSTVEALLPAFMADPNKYADAHPDTNLPYMHPLYDRRNSGMPEAWFQSEANKTCDGFVQ